MIGLVEIYAVNEFGEETLLLQDENLVVDSGTEAVVDMLTTPSSVLKYSPEVMDASNFRIGAMSFGTALSSFQENAYYISNDSSSKSWRDQIVDDKVLRVLWSSGTIGEVHGATWGSYTPPYQLPSYPDPLDTSLEPKASTALMLVSSVPTITCFKQFENRIHFKPNDASSYFQGAYPRGSVATPASLVSSLSGDFQSLPNRNQIVSSTFQSQYNALGNMDYRGFVSSSPYSTDSTVGRLIYYGADGLDTPVEFLDDARVVYETTISADDVQFMNLYGGLHQIGLWSIDCRASLANATAPFSWIDGNGVTPRVFKLFAKKTFTENLTRLKDPNASTAGFNSAVNLKIKWILDFRSVR